MVKYFLKLLSSNITPEARRLKKKQWEKEAYMRELIAEHFRGTQLDERNYPQGVQRYLCINVT
jgi:hypothetical protein